MNSALNILKVLEIEKIINITNFEENFKIPCHYEKNRQRKIYYIPDKEDIIKYFVTDHIYYHYLDIFDFLNRGLIPISHLKKLQYNKFADILETNILLIN